MSMRLLVLGGTGMVGHKMFQRLRMRFPDTWCTVRGSHQDWPVGRVDLFAPPAQVVERLDAAEWPSVDAVLARLRPDVVVNCVGIIKQRPEANTAIPSITINALLPHRLAAALATWGGRLVHISTDCVFSGRRGRYTEDDPSDAEDLYGRTKYLGEVSDLHAITLRTSVIGRELTERRSLLEWLLQQDGRTIRGYTRALYSGLTTIELAAVVERLVADHPRLSGVYHVVSDTISKYDLLRLIVEEYELDITVEPDDQFFCDRSLVGTKFEGATGYRCPPWPDLIRALHADPTPYNDWAREGVR